MKPVVLTEQTWLKIREHLFQTQPKSVMLTRWKMREVIGFTDRRQTEYVDTRQMAGEFGVPEYGSRRQPRQMICLDFYDEPKRTMFLLKYSDWIKQ